MEPLFQGAGRPRREESDERSRAFVRRVTEGCSLADAARRSRLSPTKALRLLEDPVLLQVVVATRLDVPVAA